MSRDLCTPKWGKSSLMTSVFMILGFRKSNREEGELLIPRQQPPASPGWPQLSHGWSPEPRVGCWPDKWHRAWWEWHKQWIVFTFTHQDQTLFLLLLIFCSQDQTLQIEHILFVKLKKTVLTALPVYKGLPPVDAQRMLSEGRLGAPE